MRVDDAAPDTDRVELGILLRAGPQLLLHELEVDVPEFVPVQVDALVGEEVRGGPVDSLFVVVSQDPDQGAVHVEGDRSDVHALRPYPPLGKASAPSVGRPVGAVTGRPGRWLTQAACSSRFACRTSLLA